MRHRRRRARAARLLAMPIALLAGVAAFGSGQAQASPRVGPGGWQSYLEQPATGNVRAVSATVLAVPRWFVTRRFSDTRWKLREPRACVYGLP